MSEQSLAEQFREMRERLLVRKKQLEAELSEINGIIGDVKPRGVGRPRGSRNKKPNEVQQQ